MAMKMENISTGKVIGIGEVTILPGEVKEIPAAYEASPVLEVYKKMGFARITGKACAPAKTQEEIEAEKKAEAEKAATDAEELRKARLASLEGISEEGLASLANELGINPAECKDQADVLKKVKEALTIWTHSIFSAL